MGFFCKKWRLNFIHYWTNLEPLVFHICTSKVTNWTSNLQNARVKLLPISMPTCCIITYWQDWGNSAWRNMHIAPHIVTWLTFDILSKHPDAPWTLLGISVTDLHLFQLINCNIDHSFFQIMLLCHPVICV